MTFGQLKAEFALKIGDVAFEKYRPLNVQRWINTANKELLKYLPDDLLIPLTTQSSQTTTAGTNNYTLPTDLVRMIYVTMAGNVCYEMDMDEAVRASKWNVDYKPTTYDDSIWYIRNNKIEFIPTPYETGLTILINYIKEPADLSADGDIPIYYPRHHYLIVLFSVYLAKTEEGTADAVKYYNAFRTQIDADLGKYVDTHALTKQGREANK